MTTPEGTATSATGFTVAPGPGITSFTPALGGTGTPVTIKGAGFTGATAVAFNSTAATFTAASDTTITTSVPAGATTGAITVTTPGGTGTSPSAFTFVPAPAIAGFSPALGGTGTSVTVTGTNFTTATAVAFNGTAAATFSVAGATSITATVPAGATTGPISVTTLGGTASSASSFTFVPAPAITSFSPASGKVGLSVTLTGTNLSSATAVLFNGLEASSFTVAGPTSIVAVVPAGASSGPISVTTPGGTGTSSTSFTVVPPPVISGFTPPSGGPGVTVILTGTHFTGASAVLFNGTAATSFNVVNDTTLTAMVPPLASTGTITVTTPGGSANSTRFVAGSLAVFSGVPSGIGNVDNASAAAARFFGPNAVAVAPGGIVYVADRLNNVIRKITAGVVSTLAGKANMAGKTNSAPGTSALFNDPAGVVVGPVTGNIYVADRGNSNIRMITPAGTVTTFSGTGTSGHDDGTSASIPAPSYFHPSALAVDAAETLYVADSGNNSIRKIVPASPGTLPVTVTTLAAVFSNPSALAVANGVVYLADTGNGAIKTIQSNLTVATLATGFTNPMGVAADTASPANIYVADAGANLISVINSSNGVVTAFAGWGNHSGSAEGFGSTPANITSIGTAPEFDFPAGIALDAASSNLFLADFNNNTIRRIPITAGVPPTSTATTSVYAGKAGAPGHNLVNGSLSSGLFNGPAGVAVDGAGNVYVADSNNNLIRKLNPATGIADLTPSGPAFSTPSGVAVDTGTGSGNIYVADTGHSAIQVISGTTATTLNAGTTFSSPYGVAVDGAGNVYVADTFNNLVKKVTIANPTSYPVTGTTTSLPGSYNHPFAVAVGSNGNVYVADTYNNAIEMVAGGVFSTLAGSASGAAGFADGSGSQALFNHPNGLALDPATGNLYVSDTYNQAIRMVATSGPAAGTVVTLVGVGTLGAIAPGALPAGLAFPFGIAVDPSLTTDAAGNSNPNGSLIISVNDAILTSPF